MEPTMMAIDLIASIINQQHLIRCIERLENIDYKLSKENIAIGYRSIQRLSVILIVVIMCRKYAITTLSIAWYDLNFFQLWFVYVPVFVVSLSKIWFVLIICNIRAKYEAINSYLDDLGTTLKLTKESCTKFSENNSDTHNQSSSVARDSINPASSIDLGYLPKEIFVKTTSKEFFSPPKPNVTFVKPLDNDEEANNVNHSANVTKKMANGDATLAKNGKTFSVGDKFDQRLTNLCFIHDEICEIAGIANYMFSFQMLMLMAYGFLAITAQLYFVYCGLAAQVNKKDL